MIFKYGNKHVSGFWQTVTGSVYGPCRNGQRNDCQQQDEKTRDHPQSMQLQDAI
jgi:hypothetical protein